MNLRLDARGDLQHFFLIERSVRGARGHVGDARDPEDANPAVPRGDNLGNRGHADKVGADGAQRINFRGGFVARALHGEVDAIVDVLAELFSFFCDEALEFAIVCLGHIGEAQAETLVVRADEGIDALQVDVIANRYQAALRSSCD